MSETRTIKERQLAGEMPIDIRGTPEWDKLRSEIYIRDRGICWVCNAFVLLSQYELGHLIDYNMKGDAVYENLAVMHEYCNGIKPDHNTLEDAMKWKLIPRSMVGQSTIKSDTIITTRIIPTKPTTNLYMTPDEKICIEKSILEYFKDKPELLVNGANNGENYNRKKAIQGLATQYKVSYSFIHRLLLQNGLIQKQTPILPNDEIYGYISEHLKELVDKYNMLTCSNWDKPKALGITSYRLLIMFYLSGNSHLINPTDLYTVSNRAKQLNIQVVPMPIISKQKNVRKISPPF